MKQEVKKIEQNGARPLLPAVAVRQIKLTIKNMEDHTESITGIGCNFWACEGFESGRIKSMVTCSICRSIIINRREIARLKAVIGNGR